MQQSLRSDGEPWKFAHDFEPLSNVQVVAMATAARAHVKACFATEAAVLAEIDAGRVTTPGGGGVRIRSSDQGVGRPFHGALEGEAMISHRHKCILIHIQKSAGSSMEAALGVPDLASFEDALDREHGKHSRLSLYREHFPAEFRSYFKFCFARNPWDRLVSMYTYRRAKRARVLEHLESAGLNGKAARKRARSHPTDRPFREFALDPITPDAGAQIIEQNGDDMQPDLDFIGRFENLADDFAKVAAHVGLDASLPHVNKSDRAHYRSYYDDETREAVARRAAVDIERFGYVF